MPVRMWHGQQSELTVQETEAPQAQRSYFERERERLVAEIAEGIETLIGSTNAVNRKLEEHASVGKGFESISELWGRFSELMAEAGLPPVAPPAAARQSDEGEAPADVPTERA